MDTPRCFLSYFFVGDFLFLLTDSPSPGGDDRPDLICDIELVGTCVPFFGGLPILLPEALILGILPVVGLHKATKFECHKKATDCYITRRLLLVEYE